MLVQIKHSLLNDLKGKPAVESGINTGDILAMAHNGKGQIIALKNAGDGVKVCKEWFLKPRAQRRCTDNSPKLKPWP